MQIRISIFPVRVLVSVIKFVDQPGDILLNPGQIFIHEPKGFTAEFFILLLVQMTGSGVCQNAEVMKAESFSLEDFPAEFFIFLIDVEKGIYVPLKSLVKILADITGMISFFTPDAEGIFLRGRPDFFKKPLSGSAPASVSAI